MVKPRKCFSFYYATIFPGKLHSEFMFHMLCDMTQKYGKKNKTTDINVQIYEMHEVDTWRIKS